MRKGFSLITAIMFIVLIATLGALSLSFSTQTSKQTTDLYLKSQAELLVRSATEFALLAISGHEINATNGCLNTINMFYPKKGENAIFNIKIDIQYFGNGLPAGCNTLDNNVNHPDIQRIAMIDVFVSTANDIANEPIRIHRRTLQKP